MSKPKPGKHPAAFPTAAERRRQAAKQTVMRSAKGSIVLSKGRFVTPKDKSLNNLDEI